MRPVRLECSASTRGASSCREVAIVLSSASSFFYLMTRGDLTTTLPMTRSDLTPAFPRSKETAGKNVASSAESVGVELRVMGRDALLSKHLTTEDDAPVSVAETMKREFKV
jgi:hypothetical protein